MSFVARADSPGAVWSIRLSFVGLVGFALWLALGLMASPLFFGVDGAPKLGWYAVLVEFGATVLAMVAYGFRGWRSSWMGSAWALGLIAGNAAALAWFAWIVVHIPSF